MNHNTCTLTELLALVANRTDEDSPLVAEMAIARDAVEVVTRKHVDHSHEVIATHGRRGCKTDSEFGATRDAIQEEATAAIKLSDAARAKAIAFLGGQAER